MKAETKKENKMSEKEIMVSIIMPVYNHESYLSQAIDSVVNQKTDFAIELLIGEDVSTDRSRLICQEYEAKYKDIIRVFYREKNMGGLENSYNLAENAKGKYCITLEGDDYWTDMSKLQVQVDFLNSHPEYIGCSHGFCLVDENGNQLIDKDYQCQFFDGKVYTVKEFEKGQFVSHINTIMYHNIFKDDTVNTSFIHEFNNIWGDATMMALLVSLGSIYHMPQKMSCYRRVTHKSSSSFTAEMVRKNIREEIFCSQLYLEKHFGGKISFKHKKKEIFASAVFKWYRDRSSKDFEVVKKIIRKSRQPIRYSVYFVYLITLRKLLDIFGRRDKRVPF